MQIGQKLPVLLPGACFVGAGFPIASAHGVGMPDIVMAGIELSLAIGAPHDGATPPRETPKATIRDAICRANMTETLQTPASGIKDAEQGRPGANPAPPAN